MGFLNQIFSTLGQQVMSSPDVQQAAAEAQQGFVVLVGQLTILIFIAVLILARIWRR